MSAILTAIAAFFALLALAGCGYFLLCIGTALSFVRQRRQLRQASFAPPVSILRSLRGVDPQMYRAFRSHCLLEYPKYEVLFGVSDPNEPALELVRKLQQEFPQRAIRIVYCPQVLGLNGKVSNLAQMLPQAQYEHIVINDSDILVPPDYLLQLMSPFADTQIGMVTTLYRGLAANTLGSKLEALGLSTDFAAGVLVARAIEGNIHFALGATIATTKTVLREIGGLEPLVDYLGDDYELGARTAQAGHKVVLSRIAVETALPAYDFRGFWEHQMRWARNIKDRRGAQYFGLIVTFALVWAVLAVIFARHARWAWLVLALTAVLRFGAAVVTGSRVLHDEQIWRDLWLLPLRDFAGLAIWMASFFGDEVEWRGLRFKLRDGKLERI